MKSIVRTFTFAAVMSVGLIACQKDSKDVQEEPISAETLAKIQSHGFGLSTVERTDGGYLIEGDIPSLPK